ncbi:MAG: hypothetical protein HYX92_11305 [Chloroflexi bacterium]|nr:hypothetical protein [Chloroflexota bacterium]
MNRDGTGRSSSFALCVSATVALLWLSCAPAAAPASAPKPAAAVATEAPQAKSAPSAPTSTKPSAEAPKYGGTMTVALKTATAHFDMLQATSGSQQVPLAPAYNLLIQHNPTDDFKITGDLAKSWEISADGLIYTFPLNEGVKFHNGKLLTAEDVRFNLDRIVNPPKGILSPRKELYRSVDRIEAPDPGTVKITLKQVQASFLTLAALPYNFIADPDIVRQKGDMKRDVVGSGPFN